ncbi:hypothetical protein VPH35_072675 [Triticum aestivum]
MDKSILGPPANPSAPFPSLPHSFPSHHHALSLPSSASSRRHRSTWPPSSSRSAIKSRRSAVLHLISLRKNVSREALVRRQRHRLQSSEPTTAAFDSPQLRHPHACRPLQEPCLLRLHRVRQRVGRDRHYIDATILFFNLGRRRAIAQLLCSDHSGISPSTPTAPRWWNPGSKRHL